MEKSIVALVPVNTYEQAEVDAAVRTGVELLGGIGPEGFLGAVRGAARLVTDSFHGLVFGTLFGVPVTPLRRDREGDPESKNSRVDQFMRLTREKGTAELRETGRRWLGEQLARSGKP